MFFAPYSLSHLNGDAKFVFFWCLSHYSGALFCGAACCAAGWYEGCVVNCLKNIEINMLASLLLTHLQQTDFI